MTVKVEIDNHCTNEWVPSDTNCEEWLQTTFDHLQLTSNCIVSLQFVTSEESQHLNQQYRDKQSPTNVLSFPADLPDEVKKNLDILPLGDIAICPSILEQEAKEQHKEITSHWAHIAVHGCLHLLGFDHQTETDAAKMEQLEIEILKKLGISNPYLIG